MTDKLRALSQRTHWTVPQLRRQFAYDRLLARLYVTDDSWVLKGAIALLAREIGVRGSLDIEGPLSRSIAVSEVERLDELARQVDALATGEIELEAAR